MRARKKRGSEGLLRGVYGPEPVHASPLRKEFEPWHKPRKQYIREFQWCREVRSLLQAGLLREGRPLRYLGLPGQDLLDVRSLHKVCASQGISLRLLGFNDQLSGQIDITELNISKNEVANLSHIHPGSRILPDDVRHIAKQDSVALAMANEFAPFDVINLDLCNSFAVDSPGADDSYYNALESIARIQVKRTTSPWLLFLTTYIGHGGVSVEALKCFMACLAENITNNPTFRADMESKLRLPLRALQRTCESDGGSDRSAYFRAFGVGIGKWLLRLLMSATPKWSIQMLQSYSYRVNNSREPNMLSCAYRFDPLIEPPQDPAGLAHSRVEGRGPSHPSEAELACGLVSRVKGIVDLDAILQNNPPVKKKMTLQSADLLESARYSRDAYLEWVG